MKPTAQGIEAISVKRARIVDADKVRYRVYRSPTDFIAVIAESALMAMKVAGVPTPYRIMRDLPSEGIAIEAKKMATIGDEEARVPMAIQLGERKESKFRQAEMSDAVATPLEGRFVPMQLADLQKKSIPWARVLTPDMVQAMQRKAPEIPKIMTAPKPPPVAHPEWIPEHLAEEVLPEPVLAEPVVDMAPVVEDASAPTAADEEVLSPEEVERLLNS